MKKTLVSIITVVYNGEKYLQQTIESVINQTYEHIEYIIIDGGSTDGTLDILKKYEEHIAYWVSEPDNGLYDAMNKGIQIAKGELIGMINSDDWYELNAVETIVNTYKANPSKAIFHADRYDVKPDETKAIRKFNPSTFKFKYYGMTYNHPSMFITANEYKEHLYSTKYKSHADYNFVFEALVRNKSMFHYVPETIVNFRLGGISAQMNLSESSKDVFTIRKNNGFNLFQCGLGFTLMRVVKILGRFKT